MTWSRVFLLYFSLEATSTCTTAAFRLGPFRRGRVQSFSSSSSAPPTNIILPASTTLSHNTTTATTAAASTTTVTPTTTKSFPPSNKSCRLDLTYAGAGGYYPVIPLRFPNCHNVRLQFSLDTGANMNVVDTVVAHALCLPVVGCTTVTGLGGIFAVNMHRLEVALGIGGGGDGAAAATTATSSYDDKEETDETRIIPDLTAAAIQNMPTSGLLGSPFFDSFVGGVEFDWYGTTAQTDDEDNNSSGCQPSVRFYHELVNFDTLIRVPLLRSDDGLFFLNLNVNGVELVGLLDTGSPITVLNPEAASLANINIVDESFEPMLEQEVGDKVLTAAGVDGGQEMQLRRSQELVSLSAGSASLGSGHVYVGTMPGVAVWKKGRTSQHGGQQKPAAVLLGRDFLQRTKRMVLRSTRNEIFF